jgi:hypothetical protein
MGYDYPQMNTIHTISSARERAVDRVGYQVGKGRTDNQEMGELRLNRTRLVVVLASHAVSAFFRRRKSVKVSSKKTRSWEEKDTDKSRVLCGLQVPELL